MYVYYNYNGGKPDSLEVLVIQTCRLHKTYKLIEGTPPSCHSTICHVVSTGHNTPEASNFLLKLPLLMLAMQGTTLGV